jgi:AcrR family transcriptional regulator
VTSRAAASPRARRRPLARARRGAGRDADGTRARLVQAAAEVIEAGGWASASVGAIAERAGVAAGTLYRHFDAKAALFLEVFRTASERELAAMRAAQAAESSVAARFDAIVRTYASRALASRRLAWALVYEPLDASVDAERLRYRRTYCDAMAALLRQGIQSGELPAQDAQLAAAAVVGAIAETLVSPLSPVARDASGNGERVAAIVAICRRVVGLPAPA